MIEMVARTLKHWLRKETREEMKRLQVPLEAPYKKLIVSRLNAIFARFPSRTGEEFWGEKLPDLLRKKYFDGEVFLPEEKEEGFNFRDYVAGCLENHPSGMALLSSKLISMLKIKLGGVLDKKAKHVCISPPRRRCCYF